MNIIFHLSSCSTCQRILREINPPSGFVMQDIKSQPVLPDQLDELKRMAGSYEALFSRIAMKYRQWGLHEKTLTEKDFRELILKEYTFLKRPVIVAGNKIFIGNSKKTIAAARKVIRQMK